MESGGLAEFHLRSKATWVVRLVSSQEAHGHAAAVAGGRGRASNHAHLRVQLRETIYPVLIHHFLLVQS